MKVLQRWSECYDKRFKLQAGTDSDGGEEWTMCVQTELVFKNYGRKRSYHRRGNMSKYVQFIRRG